MWFTPRTAILPYSGQLWPRNDGWHEGPTGFAITLGLALLNFLYVGLAILGITHWRASPGIALIVAFVVIRTAFLTQLQTCEPRYVLVCFPALLSLGAQYWRGRWKLASTLAGRSSDPTHHCPAQACASRTAVIANKSDLIGVLIGKTEHRWTIVSGLRSARISW
jgi:hypothetical protein